MTLVPKIITVLFEVEVQEKYGRVYNTRVGDLSVIDWCSGNKLIQLGSGNFFFLSFFLGSKKVVPDLD